MKTKTVSVRLDESDYKKLECIAKEKGISRSKAIEEFIRYGNSNGIRQIDKDIAQVYMNIISIINQCDMDDRAKLYNEVRKLICLL